VKLRVDIKFKGDPVDTLKLRVYSAKAQGAISSYASITGREMEQYAKRNHPWKNRTGNAEMGLHTTVTASKQGWIQNIQLSHGPDVWYGYYLENSMGKRFAIIEPTMMYFSGRVVNELGSIFNNINGVQF